MVVDPRGDCFFYMTSACSKGAACNYRHQESAKHTFDVCEFWGAQQPCTRDNCAKRHSSFHLASTFQAVTRKRDEIPCYWETQGGCQKPNCPFKHLYGLPGGTDLSRVLKANSTAQLTQTTPASEAPQSTKLSVNAPAFIRSKEPQRIVVERPLAEAEGQVAAAALRNIGSKGQNAPQDTRLRGNGHVTKPRTPANGIQIQGVSGGRKRALEQASTGDEAKKRAMGQASTAPNTKPRGVKTTVAKPAPPQPSIENVKVKTFEEIIAAKRAAKQNAALTGPLQRSKSNPARPEGRGSVPQNRRPGPTSKKPANFAVKSLDQIRAEKAAHAPSDQAVSGTKKDSAVDRTVSPSTNSHAGAQQQPSTTIPARGLSVDDDLDLDLQELDDPELLYPSNAEDTLMEFEDELLNMA